MGKKIVQKKQQHHRIFSSNQNVKGPQTVPNFSISDKSYVRFFQFLKELHISQGQEKACQSDPTSSLNDITTSIMNFFNYQKEYSTKQLECSIICLANLFNVIGNSISKLHFEGQFVSKVRRFLSDLASLGQHKGFNQKIQAIFYIFTVLIYKQRIGQEKTIRDLNRVIFKDRIIVNSLLDLVLPLQKKLGKFYGIVIVYLTSKKLNNILKKRIVKSILINFCNIDHQQTLLNLLVYLRSEKNKVSINFKDIQEGKIFQVLLETYPKHIHQYQSFYILDYLHHLLLLFPSLVQQVAKSRFLVFLLQNSGPGNLHHPLHSSTIIQFIQKTLKYLEPVSQHKILQEILQIEHTQHYITIKLTQILLSLEEVPETVPRFGLNGYFNRLLNIIRDQPEETIKLRTIQLYLVVIEKVAIYNQPFSQFLSYKIQAALFQLRDESKQKFIQLFHSRMQRSTQLII